MEFRFATRGSLETMQMEDYDAMMATNVRAVVELTHLAVPHLIATKGCIINVSSALSIATSPRLLGYAMTKAALDHFTKCVAMELAGKGVRCCAVNPGKVYFHTSSIFILIRQMNFRRG